MGAYHQMGHTSWNLVGEDELADFSGIVLSPVNDSPEQVIERLGRLRESVNHRKEIILDPQFYKPSSDRGRITSWPHFSNDLDTADLGDIGWWRKGRKSSRKWRTKSRQTLYAHRPTFREYLDVAIMSL